ncbi:hypothetical protein A2U01_0009675 [Trifolium medium]|uniref:Uncharacterized protein n=1 Tax=Trifolium medium TaxID=97028 RepID=A0A392MMM9_9FABA|nr:hypothetical protein [Trifolium medium]
MSCESSFKVGKHCGGRGQEMATRSGAQRRSGEGLLLGLEQKGGGREHAKGKLEVSSTGADLNSYYLSNDNHKRWC